MRKTTVYLPDALKLALERAAASEGRSESDLIREGVRLVTGPHQEPPPRLPLFVSGKGGLAERVNRALEGFGES